jgi:hypothetical protein
MGMGTILVGEGPAPDYVDVQIADASAVPQALAQWMNR